MMQKNRFHGAAGILALALGTGLAHTTAQGQDLLMRNGFETLEPADLIGTWNGVNDDYERVSFVFSEDGTVRDEYYSYTDDRVLNSETGTWSLRGSTLVIDWEIDGGPGIPLTYRSEPVSGVLLLQGGELGTDVYRLHRQATGSNGQPLEPLLFGLWYEVDLTLGWVMLYLSPDGDYWLSVTPTRLDAETDIETGRWWVDAGQQRMFMRPDGGPVTESAYSTTILVTPSLRTAVRGVEIELNRDRTPQGSLAAVAGQYASENATLTLRPDGSGDLIHEGQRYPLTARMQADADHPGPSPKYVAVDIPGITDGEALLSCWCSDGLQFNSDSALHSTLGKFYRHTAGDPILPPGDLTGNWSVRTEEDFLTLLPGGRYWRRDRTVGWDVRERGDYRIEGGSITLDPDCAAPSTKPVMSIADQMIIDATVHHYIPASQDQTRAEKTRFDALLGADNTQWEARIPLAAVEPSNMTATPTDLGADPQPLTVFQGATVFEESQSYFFLSPLTTARTFDGRIVTYLPELLLFDEALAASIDYSGGTFNDQFSIVFYPNGRVVRQNKVYSTPLQIHPTITPRIDTAWDRYRIEGGRLYIGDEPFDLMLGRRRVRQGDYCYDNLTWSNAGSAAASR